MIYIGADHRGFKLKKYIIRYLDKQLKIKAEDLGAFEYDPADDAPNFALSVAKKVAKQKDAKGILICWTGHSMCITANKVKGAYAILGQNVESAEMSRKHNDANILCLPSKFLTNEHAVAIAKKFLETEFQNDKRLLRRINKIKKIENTQRPKIAKIQK